MTKKSLTRTLIGILGAGSIFAVPILTILYALPNQEKSIRNIRTVVNGANNAPSFYYNLSDSYGNDAVGEENVYLNSFHSSLVRSRMENENILGWIRNDMDDPDNPKPVFGEAKDKVVREYYELELAEAIIIKRNNTISHIIFNDDEYEEMIISNKYKKVQDGGNVPNNVKFVKFNYNENLDIQNVFNGGGQNEEASPANSMEYVIRENMYWVDHTGQKTDYEIIAEDFYYSMLHTGLSNNVNRNRKYDSNKNPFGGHGNIGGEVNENVVSWELSRSLDSTYAVNKFSSESFGFKNEYLYTMFGLATPSDMIKSDNISIGVSDSPQMIGTFNNYKTVKFDTTFDNPNFYGGMKKFLADGRSFAPAPSQFIKENHSNRKKVREYDLPEGLAKETGFYTYGDTNDNTLYASPYYVSESNQFKIVLEQNKHYWDKKWIDSKESIEKYTVDFSPSGDDKIFSKSIFSQFKAGNVYKADYNALDSKTQIEVMNNTRKFGVRYSKSYNADHFHSDMLPFMFPAPQTSSSSNLFNDGLAATWFGAPLSKINSGDQSIVDYLNEKSIAFRSQLTAAVNWFGISRRVAPDGSQEEWLSYMPPEISLSTKDGSNSTAYDYIETLNTVEYFSESNGNLTKHSITPSENKKHYIENASSSKEQMKSANFNNISDMITSTIDSIYADKNINQNTKIELPIKSRTQVFSDSEDLVLKSYKNILEEVDPRINVTIHYPSLEWPYPLTELNGISTFGGWTSDYDGAASMFSGFSTNATSIQAMAMSVNKNDFPELHKYGEAFETFIDITLPSQYNLSSVAKNYLEEVKIIKEYKNNIASTLAGNSTYFNHIIKDYSNETNTSVVNELIKYKDTLKSSVSTFDMNYALSKTDDEYINLIKEVTSIMGVNFGFKRSIIDRSQAKPVMFLENLSIPISKSGKTYLRDWKIGVTRAQEFN